MLMKLVVEEVMRTFTVQYNREAWRPNEDFFQGDIEYQHIRVADIENTKFEALEITVTASVPGI